VIAIEQRRLTQPIGTLQLERLRREFLSLMDAAGVAIQRAGLDFDECVLDRFAAMRFVGDPHVLTVEVVSLTDVARLEQPFRKLHAASHGRSPADRAVEVVVLEVCARHDPGPHGDGAPPP